MPYNPRTHHRRSIRLPSHDYAAAGAYFVTVCTHEHVPLFGQVVDGTMHLTSFGRIASDEWYRTAVVRASIILDAFIVMPDHVHGIIVISSGSHPGSTAPFDGPCSRGTPPVCPYGDAPHHLQSRAGDHLFGQAAPGSIPTIMRQYKSIVTKRINRLRGTPGAPVWQRNYFERVVRNGRGLERIRSYIVENPARWAGGAGG